MALTCQVLRMTCFHVRRRSGRDPFFSCYMRLVSKVRYLPIDTLNLSVTLFPGEEEDEGQRGGMAADILLLLDNCDIRILWLWMYEFGTLAWPSISSPYTTIDFKFINKSHYPDIKRRDRCNVRSVSAGGTYPTRLDLIGRSSRFESKG